jgi:long-chain acyl-CoA synthetase
VPLELSGLIRRQARYRPDRLAAVLEGERLTYREFWSRVARVGNMLRSLGIGPGDKVATVAGNSLDLLAIYWAVPSIGAVLVPLSPLLLREGLASLLEGSDARCVIAQAAMLPVLRAMAGELPGQVLILEGGDTGFGDFPKLCGTQPDDMAPFEARPDDLFNIMFTSGTTGVPKGIMHTHVTRSMYATLMGQAFRMTPESRTLHAGAIVFNGAFVTMVPTLYLGGTYVLLRQFDPEDAIATIERERITHTMLVPAQIVAILGAKGYNPRRLESLECILSLGAPLMRQDKERLSRELPRRLYELYGLTEGFATILDRDDVERKAGSVGVPPAFYRMRIERPDGSECAVGEPGEIVGRGPIVAAGYYKRPDLTAQAWRDGWLHTGDVGFVDEEGYLHLVDRMKDMIDSGGVKVYPRDVEEVAARHPDVREVAVFGVPHDKWGETPVAAVILKAGAKVAADDLRTWINERVSARFQRVSAVVLMEDFPRSTAGKTLKREMREPYWKGSGRRI